MDRRSLLYDCCLPKKRSSVHSFSHQCHFHTHFGEVTPCEVKPKAHLAFRRHAHPHPLTIATPSAGAVVIDSSLGVFEVVLWQIRRSASDHAPNLVRAKGEHRLQKLMASVVSWTREVQVAS